MAQSKTHKSRTGGAKHRNSPKTTAVPTAASIEAQELRTLGKGRDTGIIEEEPKKQWWRRLPNSKTRKVAAKIVVLRAAGHSFAAIAKKLDTTPGTVNQALFVARKNGWLDEAGEMIDLETELALSVDRKIVRNLNASLDGKMTNWQSHETTLAAAKGRGIFKNHEAGRSESTAPMGMIGIQIIMPPIGAGDQKMEIPENMVGGVPSYTDGEIDATADSHPVPALGPGTPD